ncbi:splicing factor 3B subunit 1-like [Oopsacas minuta]|uniref:Splicing factor 3B subunit 1-like n=1 Tax=Oopsacas minuta TaxID=111878 RepID=A0AAV7JSY0_9METZ|nr:splicing factor 3B subunit 1-like [Oopsacas minuta]
MRRSCRHICVRAKWGIASREISDIYVLYSPINPSLINSSLLSHNPPFFVLQFCNVTSAFTFLGDYTPRDNTPSSQGFSTPIGMGVTPSGLHAMGMGTPAVGSMTPEQLRAMRWNLELDERNCYMTDDELDSLFPQEGYTILSAPDGYKKLQTPTRRLQATPTPTGVGGFHFQMKIMPIIQECND